MQIEPLFVPPLDPGFQPAVLVNHRYLAAAGKTGQAVPLVIGLERERGLVSRYETRVFPAADAATLQYVERTVKFLLWARGGWKIFIGGPKAIGEFIRKTYSPPGARKFDCELMGSAYGKKLQVVVTTPEKVPADGEMEVAAGGHLKGCRIGFDLGASDYKVSAVMDGEAIFTEESPWDPKSQPNPEYHYHHISAALHRAAAHLPRVDAIGGSSAGIIVDNEIRVASLLRADSEKGFSEGGRHFQAHPERMERAGGGDERRRRDRAGRRAVARQKGHAGHRHGFERGGRLHGQAGPHSRAGSTNWPSRRWITIPLPPRMNGPATAAWARCIFRSRRSISCCPPPKISLPEKMGLPERLKEVQALMAKGDPRAAKIYETIGVYLGYAMAHYADFYDFRHVLILGRVTTGQGGEIVLDKARAGFEQGVSGARKKSREHAGRKIAHCQAWRRPACPN